MKTLIATLLLASTTFAHADGAAPVDRDALHKVIHPSEEVVAMIDGSDEDRAYLPPEPKIMDNAAACSAAVKDALAKGADPALTILYADVVSFKVVRTEYALGETDAKVCQVAAEKAKGLDDRRAKAAGDAIEAKLGPYKKLGVAGDKLALIDKFWNEVLGPNQANPTPQVVAKSSVLFRLIKDDDWNYTLMRYQFHGNKRVRVTLQSFHHDPPASLYR